MTQVYSLPAIDDARCEPPPARGGVIRRMAGTFMRTRRPRLMLLLVIAVVYGPSLGESFIVDDLRNLRIMEEYHRGARDHLGLYEFIRDADDNAAQRARGELLWWVADGLHWAYLRPLTERFLYAEYLLFGREAFGYRAVGLVIFVIVVWLVLALLRRWHVAEPIARTAAALFAVAACNTMPVTFIAEHCDLLALLGVLVALLAATEFVEGRGAARLGLATCAYAAALLSKETAVPAAVLPAILLLARRGLLQPATLDARAKRRVLLVTATFGAMALALVGYYAHAAYGSNSLAMLDPARDPVRYVRELPIRAAVLLASWLLPLNPILLYTGGGPYGPLVFAALGAAILVPLGVWLWRRYGGEPALLAFACWPLPFLPLLVCTAPDTRILSIPMIGLCVLGAYWLLRPPAERDGESESTAPRPRRTAASWLPPTLLLIVFPVLEGVGAQLVHTLLHRNCSDNFRAAIAGFDRPTRRDDCIFILNTHWMLDAMWAHDRLLQLVGADAPQITYLSHLMEVRPEVLGPRRLRLHAIDAKQPFFSTAIAIGLMTQREPPRAWTSRMKEFTAFVRADRDGRVTAVDFEFAEPLDSPRYRFYFLVPNALPRRWRPGA